MTKTTRFIRCKLQIRELGSGGRWIYIYEAKDKPHFSFLRRPNGINAAFNLALPKRQSRDKFRQFVSAIYSYIGENCVLQFRLTDWRRLQNELTKSEWSKLIAKCTTKTDADTVYLHRTGTTD